MLDLQHYAKANLNNEDAALFLKHFEKYEFNSLYSLIRQLNQIEEKLSWVSKADYKNKLISLCAKFAIQLEDSKQPLSEKIDFLESQLEIATDFPEFEWKSNAHGGTCPKCGKKELFVPQQGQAKNIKCSRESNCGYSSSIFNYLKEYKNLSTKDALDELASLGGIDLKSYETSLEFHIDKPIINFKLEKKIKEHKENIETIQNILYTNLDSSINFKEINYLDLVNKYHTMNDKQKFMMLVTSIYNFSLLTNQEEKYEFYKSREISAAKYPILLSKAKLIKSEIGYINYKDDVDNLLVHLVDLFPVEDLIKYGIINDLTHKFPHSFKHYSEKGFCVIPSFDLYTNMVTGLKLRNTKLAQWQSKNMKEPELSYGRIANPLPYGLNRQALLDNNATFRLFEGSVDSFSIPSFTNTYDIAIAGVNGLSREDFGLFRNKNIEIWFDQDIAGQKTANGMKTISFSFSNKELSNWSFYMKFENSEDKNITILRNENTTSIKIEIVNSDLENKKLDTYIELIKKQNIPYEETFKKGIKDLILDAGATSVIVKTWNIELGSDVNEVLQNGNLEKIL